MILFDSVNNAYGIHSYFSLFRHKLRLDFWDPKMVKFWPISQIIIKTPLNIFLVHSFIKLKIVNLSPFFRTSRIKVRVVVSVKWNYLDINMYAISTLPLYIVSCEMFMM